MRLRHALAAATLLGTALPGQDVPGLGELHVSPREVVFQARSRSQHLTVQNTGSVPATYRISLQHVQMTEDGRAEEVEGFPLSAAELVRLSPRQVVLAPGERQTVRVLLRRPERLPEGEYRIHILFRVVPPEAPNVPEAGPGQGLGIHLRALPGIAIPLFVRHGELRQALAPEALQWHPPATLEATLVQRGSQTMRGQLRIVHFRGGDPRVLASRPLVHYADLPRQRVRLDLPQEAPTSGLVLQVLDEAGKVVAEHPVPPPEGGSLPLPR